MTFTVNLLIPCPSNPSFLEGRTVEISAKTAAEAEEIARRQYPNAIVDLEE